MALNRLVPLISGRILFDGVDTSTLGLKEVRQSISNVPQDAVIYKGTLRYNLDPFDTVDDATLRDAMQRACLSEPEFSLEMELTQDNLSVGQRSLVSLARAFVNDTSIMVFDETTAAVELETDARIQAATRAECARTHKTILCSAHRLRTIIGWDRVVVMDNGVVSDFESPLELFDRKGRIFRSMCEHSGIARDEIVRAREVERA
jgi:ABC-type multidrug transport system fused ATPase/permease subunit